MIEVNQLTKRYAANTAVRDLTFSVDAGTVCGFIGPNGAGKSTTLNMLTGCLEPTSGKISINGFDLMDDPIRARRCIGYLPEQPPLYPDMTPYEYLRFVAEARGVKRSEADVQVRWAISAVQIKQMSNRLIGHLSKGYRQRVGIAQAILGDPEVIILDEPMDGLDPSQIVEMRALIRELGQKHTVLLSSHILSEVSEICDRVLIISRGVLVADDSPDALGRRMAQASTLQLRVKATEEQTRACLSGIPGITRALVQPDTQPDVVRVSLSADQTDEFSENVFRAFAQADCPLLQMQLDVPDLEDVFLALTAPSLGTATEQGKEEDDHAGSSEA
jgi:ABC-2 type transport system ATP-binding protein